MTRGSTINRKVWLAKKKKVKQTGLFLKWINYEDDVCTKKKQTLTLASRIFTIQFGDAISFAVHTVHKQGCMSISSVRCGQIHRGMFEEKNPIIIIIIK